MKAWYGEELLTADGARKVRGYKYLGGDASLIYKHITGPLAQWVITFVGFIIVTSPHIIGFIFNSDTLNFNVGTLRFVSLMQAICMFVYAILDNSDGKQARKIGASSPLGLLFDHGCDAINCGIATITLMKIVRIGNNWYLIVSMLMTIAQFYMATLEEYFVGGLFLPIINGVNEGLWMVISVLVMTFIWGDDIWLKDSLIGGMPNNLILFYILVVGGVFTLFMNVVNMLKKTDIKTIVQKCLAFFYVILSLLMMIVFCDGTLIKKYSLFLCYLFVILSSRLLLSHVADEDFKQMHFVPLLICCAMNIFSIVALVGRYIPDLERKLTEDVYLGFLVGLTVASLISSVTVELAAVLDINIFSIRKKPAVDNREKLVADE